MGKNKCDCDSLERENAELKKRLEKIEHLEHLTWQREDFENKVSRSTGSDKDSYSDALKNAIESEKHYRNALRKEKIIE